ncbi:MAG TPA: TIGR03364 family FAD-dependent oxidoreductase [Pseudonocardiaceae bacterium]|nr:TIGR03364 family FAD-dependent oxidoreductase [Pseudonocardiaceae bacterium]
MRIVIVGGGVLGTMHAWCAVRRGHQVRHLERELEARAASVRNFGLVWVGGRAPGVELDTALRARELWARIATEVPGVGFRANGSLTVLRSAAELAVAEQVVGRDDARRRGFTLLTAAQTVARNPALGGELLGALHCGLDAAVESRVVLPALRARLAESGRYSWLPGREARDVDRAGVRDDHGDRHAGDLVLLCPGAALAGLVRELATDLPLRRVRLQMMQTEPFEQALTTSVADGDSLRYYPAYRGSALDELTANSPQAPIAAAHAMQLLMVQRLDGGLTIGDTHGYTEPFPFDLREEPYQHLVSVAEALLGRRLPPVRQRWAGVYAERTDTGHIALRQQVANGVFLITGPGGRGMTCSPAIAESTTEELQL